MVEWSENDEEIELGWVRVAQEDASEEDLVRADAMLERSMK